MPCLNFIADCTRMRYTFDSSVRAALMLPLHKRSDNAFPHAAASRCKLGILDGKLNTKLKITKLSYYRLNSIQNLLAKLHNPLNEGFVISTLALCGSCLTALTPAMAQILPDGSLGNEASIVVPDVEINRTPSERIDGGAMRGANLFHSFQEFNIPEGRGAYFSNPNGIINILTRVTGANPSNIFGTLGVLGNANLFFINPNGMIFGPNSRLDLRGSFLGSTASGIAFDGFEFSSLNPQAPPLLTVNIPLGLRFRDNPGRILVTGPGHNLGIDPQTGTLDYRNRPVGLQVDENRTLALVGGELILTGGNLTAAGGRIELGSLAGEGLVNLHPVAQGWALDYTGASNFGEMRLAPVASVTTRGESGGAIGVQGRRIAIANGSVIDSSTLGTGSGGNITVRATEGIEMSGSIPGTPIPSFLLAQVQPGATGRGGDITIETQRLGLTDGGQISAITLGGGDAGNLTARATEAVELLGTSPDGQLPSGLFVGVAPRAAGRGGNLTIETPRLLIAGGAAIRTSTLGQGDAGSLTVQAQTIDLVGIAANSLFVSGLFADVGPTGVGNGGNLRLETQRLLLADGAQVSTATFGRGIGGNINVIATEVELRGISADGKPPSGLFATLESTGIGRGGNLTVNTQRLRAEGGAQIRTSTLGQGDAGSLTLQAQTIELVGTAANSQFFSGLFADVSPTGMGNGGNLRLETQRLLLADGAQIGTGMFGQGIGGSLDIVATEVELRGTSADGLFPSGLFTTLQPTGIGRGGNLTVNTQRLLVTGGATIRSSTGGRGNAGTLTLRAQTIELSGASANGQIPTALSTAVDPTGIGDGNALLIETQRLRVADGAVIVSGTAGRGNSGNLTVRAEDIEVRGTRTNGLFSSGLFSNVEPTGMGTGGTLSIETNRLQVSDGGKVEVATFGEGDAGNLIVRATESIQLSGAPEGARFASGLYGTVFILPELGITGRGQGGTLAIATERLQIDNGARIAVSDQSGVEGAGDITIDAGSIHLNNGAMIEANTRGEKNGSITLNARDIQLRRNSRMITNAAADATGGNITINSDILLAFPQENSDITANAQGGRGGRIEINVPNIFGVAALSRQQLAEQLAPGLSLNPQLLSSSDITAISEAGAQLSGQVLFSTAGVNPAQGLVELPQNVVDPASLIAANPCLQGATSQFVITGRGGLPTNPTEPLRDDMVRVTWSELPPPQGTPGAGNSGTPGEFNPSPGNAKSPATGWQIDERGNVTLIADNRRHRNSAPTLQLIGICQSPM